MPEGNPGPKKEELVCPFHGDLEELHKELRSDMIVIKNKTVWALVAAVAAALASGSNVAAKIIMFLAAHMK